jgi:hypothetical protein
MGSKDTNHQTMEFGHFNGVTDEQQTLKNSQCFKDGNLEKNIFT